MNKFILALVVSALVGVGAAAVYAQETGNDDATGNAQPAQVTGTAAAEADDPSGGDAQEAEDADDGTATDDADDGEDRKSVV